MAEADCAFLKDLGVPKEAIVIENEARNTEENAKLIAKAISMEKGKVKKEWKSGRRRFWW